MTQFKLVDGELHLEAFGDVKKVLKGWESMTGWYWFATELDVDGVEGNTSVMFKVVIPNGVIFRKQNSTLARL